ncbi:MAG: AraC family ligand binding domain-containing protein, partial [Blastochloris sp.]|nr:AraC family ligand binding domain-containing protein [Blastochloris sp.]
MLSLSTVMRAVIQTLPVPTALEGAVWHHHFNSLRQIPPHRHEELELNLSVRGRATYLMEDRHYELSRGSLVWLFPSQNHVLLEQSRDYEMWIVVFRPKLVRATCANAANRILRQTKPKGDFCKVLGEAPAARLATLAAELANVMNDPSRFNAGLAYLLMSAWAEHRQSAGIILGKEVHPAVERAAAALREDPTLNVGAVARRAGLSASRLGFLFQKQTGLSLLDFRHRQGLERFRVCYGDGNRRTLL